MSTVRSKDGTLIAFDRVGDGQPIILRDNQRGEPLSTRRWASVTIPTLVMDGGKRPAWMQHGMKALGDVLPNVTRRTLDGQTHMLKAKAVVPVLTEFFSERCIAC